MVSLQSATYTEDEAGQLSPTFLESSIPASVVEVSGTEVRTRIQINAQATTLVTMRWRPSVDPGLQIKHQGRTLGIISAADPDGRKRQIVCQCREIKAAT